jgi:hypothetical protein
VAWPIPRLAPVRIAFLRSSGMARILERNAPI